VVSGTGPLNGDGTLIVTNGGNSFTGGVGQLSGTQFNETTFVVAGNHALPGSPDISMNRAALQLTNAAQTIGDLTGVNDAFLDLANGALTINETHATDFGGIITGTGVIDYVGPGHLTISGLTPKPGPPRLSTFTGP